MRSSLPRAQNLATRTTQRTSRTLTHTTRRTFAQTTPGRNQQPTTPHYEPPSPKDSKGNDARLSRFSKLLGISVGAAGAFGYSVYKHKNKTAAETGATTSSGTPGEDGFVKLRLASREDVSSTSAILTLRGAGLSAHAAGHSREIQSVLFKQPQLQIARAYTLLPRAPGQPDDEHRFLIRRERGGEVSSYLHRLLPGAEVEVRGPQAEYVVPEGVGKVVFLAGGTGIAPALQVAGVVGGEADLHILWANRRREDCEGGKSDTVSEGSGVSWGGTFAGWFSAFGTPGKDAKAQEAVVEKREKGEIVRRLEEIKRKGAGRVAVDYFVDEEERFVRPIDVTTLVRGSFSTEAAKGGKNVMFVSGPEGFVKVWAGEKEWRDGRELQGPLGGVLGKLDLRDWEVVKL